MRLRLSVLQIYKYIINSKYYRKVYFMKKIGIIFSIVLVVSLVTGCGCSYDWVEATCTEPKHCTKCGEIEGEPLGHDYIITSEEKTTCETAGYKDEKCSRCNETIHTDLDALGHNYETIKIDPICETDGRTTTTCTICGNTTEDRVLKALGHSYQWVKTRVESHSTPALNSISV